MLKKITVTMSVCIVCLSFKSHFLCFRLKKKRRQVFYFFNTGLFSFLFVSSPFPTTCEPKRFMTGRRSMFIKTSNGQQFPVLLVRHFLLPFLFLAIVLEHTSLPASDHLKLERRYSAVLFCCIRPTR